MKVIWLSILKKSDEIYKNKLVELISEFITITGYQVKILKSVIFLYTRKKNLLIK